MPRLNSLYRRYRGAGLVVLGLNADAQAQRARRVAAREVEFPCLFEAGGVCADYGVLAYPTLVLLDRDGRVWNETGGYPGQVEHQAVELLARQPRS